MIYIKYLKSTIYVTVFLCVISACKTLNNPEPVEMAPLPLSYDTKSTVEQNLASLKWREYFGDSLLLSLIDSVLTNNADMQMAYQRIEVSRAIAQQTKGVLLPKVDIALSASQRKFGLYTMDGAGNISTEILPNQIVPIDLPDFFIGLQSSWELDVWGKLRNQRRWAVSNYLASIEGTHLVRSTLIAEVATAYFELVSLDLKKEIIEQTLQKQNEALEVIYLKKEAGRANEMAVQQFRAQIMNTRFMLTETEQKIVEVENLIHFLAGRFPRQINRLRLEFEADLPEEIQSGIPSALLERRPDIREAAFRVKASKFEVLAARKAFLPSVNLTAGIGFQAFNTELLFVSPASIAYQAMGGLISPLVNMNALKARFNSAKAGQIEAMYAYQKSILGAFTEVVNTLTKLQNLRQMNEIKAEQVAILSESVETSRELYRSARASYIEVHLAQQNELQARLELLEAQKQTRLATVQLYRSLGGGWE